LIKQIKSGHRATAAKEISVLNDLTCDKAGKVQYKGDRRTTYQQIPTNRSFP